MHSSSPACRSRQPFTGHLQYAGVDKLRISFPIEQQCSDGYAEIFTRNGVRTTITGSKLEYAKGRVQGDTGAPIYVELKDYGTTAILEFNPSRQLDLNGTTLCQPDLVEATVIWAVRQVSTALVPVWCIDKATGDFTIDDPKIWPSHWRSLVKIQRLDIARDIFISEPSFNIGTLLSIRKPNYPNDTVYRNSGKPQTIAWGKTRTLRTHIYNKSLQHDKNECGGCYRFELQARHQYLKTKGILTLEDITDDSVFELLWERWDKSKLDSDISLESGLADFARIAARMTSATKAVTLIGLAFMLEQGITIEMNPRTMSTYVKLGKSLGFSLGSSLALMGTSLVYIDFASGTLVKSREGSTSQIQNTLARQRETTMAS